jgi:hypothetical protein
MNRLRNVYTHYGVLFGHKDKWNTVIFRQMNGSGEYHVKQYKPGSKGQRLHLFPYMC